MAAAILAAGRAEADEPDPTEPPASPPQSLVWRPWRTFDPHLSHRELIVSVGPVLQRTVREEDGRGGFDASFGQSVETTVRPWLIRLQADYGLRRAADGDWSLFLPRYTYAGGLLLGPVEATARVGLSVAEVHFGARGFGLGFLSPEVGVGAAVRFGPLRIGALGFSELSWRWIGGPSTRVDGILVEVGIADHAQDLPPVYRVEK